ncbi:hypothetical protein EDB81DRAFT_778552 [Dactylonectria macrodidyma]|uniref:Uncharacterized protein n=1 Tax=Dactylonectria macrodidyma TaxID=307937 RepID=A0A9P9JQA2_9HYPO|nr:hypothetical protein EDB81DRAFT_778552 [Dactylonectria macrodidyma]
MYLVRVSISFDDIRSLTFADEVDPLGNLNPALLSITASAYRIQSQRLHIPDMLGFFASGPPCLQVHQAWLFLTFVEQFLLLLVNEVVMACVFVPSNMSLLRILRNAVIDIGLLVLLWLVSLFSPCRAADCYLEGWIKPPA